MLHYSSGFPINIHLSNEIALCLQVGPILHNDTLRWERQRVSKEARAGARLFYFLSCYKCSSIRQLIFLCQMQI